MEPGDYLGLILGGGAVATIGAFFNGVKALREGSRAREKDTVRELVKQRKQAWKERDYANKLVTYWRDRCGRAEYVVVSNGLALPTQAPEPQPDPDDDDDDDE